MKFLFYLLFVSHTLSSAQGNTYDNYRSIDTTKYRFSKALFLYDLTLTESHNEGKVILEWKKQRNITFYMIEMRDPSTQELIYRQRHYTNNAEFPLNGHFTIYPIFNRQKGESISINFKSAQANNFKPISPDSYYRFLEKQELIDDRQKLLKEQNEQELAALARYEDDRANRITPKAFILISIVLLFAFLIVFAIWLVRYLTKPKELSRQEIKEIKEKWG